MSKNTFDIRGDKIYITRPEWDFIAEATIRDDYVDEIQSVTWGLDHDRYPCNSKLGSLHSYIMKKWYGEDVCQEMKDKGFVIDHIDNVSHNCSLENLSFLSSAYNKAKGMTFDKENEDKRYIALTLSKDFQTDLYQITIVFNYPATLEVAGFDKPAVVELAYLLYDADYKTVLVDAESILLDYKNDFAFKPEKIRAIDYHIEGSIGKAWPIEVYEEYLQGAHGHGVFFFNRKAPLTDWTKDIDEKFFTIRDSLNGKYYVITL